MEQPSDTFMARFEALTAHKPFPWQERLYERFISDGEYNVPAVARIPTGLGKTSVIAIWLLALIERPQHLPRRLVYVVNRRTVVDQTSTEVVNLRNRLVTTAGQVVNPEHLSTLESLAKRLIRINSDPFGFPLAISTLRGQFADNSEWSADPSRPAVICGTVDMIGSRLLFGGYRIGFKSRPLHAGFLGQDALLVHDEAHLEPAFQHLVSTIQREQYFGERTGDLPWAKLQVMQLTATTRSTPNRDNDGGRPHDESEFELTEEEKNPPERVPEYRENEPPIINVWRRLHAEKLLTLTPAPDDKTAALKIAEIARTYEDKRAAVIVFVRTLAAVAAVQKELAKTNRHVELLTGTIRGKERDELVEKPAFKRFLKDGGPGETVFLIANSAGEVGVDISADHMVADLSTLESMIQRLGRVNRFGIDDSGKSTASRVDIVHPERLDDGDKLGSARRATLALLRRLPELESGAYSASPSALGTLLLSLADDERDAAFAPTPLIPSATDILFDAWALTTIRSELPGRPPVAPYLHGIAEWEPPQTSLAWRQEVDIVTDDLIQTNGESFPQELFDDFPLKPHELLNDISDRVARELEAIAKRLAGKNCAIWVVGDRGDVKCETLHSVLIGPRKEVVRRIAGRTLVLPPSAGGLSNGILDGTSPHADDVADRWLDEGKRFRRHREFTDTSWPLDGPQDMALIRTIDTDPDTDERQEDQVGEGDVRDGQGEGRHRRFWHWYVRPRDAEDPTKASMRPVSWETHTNDVVERATQIVNALQLPDELRRAVILAAELHDLGKQRVLWQRSIGNPNPEGPPWYAKPGKPKDGPRWQPRHLSRYRHEFGSLLDVLDRNQQHYKGLDALPSETRDLVLHLIAAHHGYARPHFPTEGTLDSNHNSSVRDPVAIEVMCRYARLQRRFGRWGLAYFESLLRAGDWAASANPSHREGSSA